MTQFDFELSPLAVILEIYKFFVFFTLLTQLKKWIRDPSLIEVMK